MRYNKFIIILAVLLSSCATQTPFTTSIQHKYKFTEEQLKKIQFYTSADIILYKVDNIDNAAITEGKIIVVNKNSSEKIIIRKNTPCLFVKMAGENKFIFSFEYEKSRVLLFGNDSAGYYSLLAKNWKMKQGTIKYGNTTYTTTDGNVFLNIKTHFLEQLRSRERVVMGRVL